MARTDSSPSSLSKQKQKLRNDTCTQTNYVVRILQWVSLSSYCNYDTLYQVEYIE